MNHIWILEVLADMQDYARRNDLPGLAAHLDDTLQRARAEIPPEGVRFESRMSDAHPADDVTGSLVPDGRAH